MGDFWNQVMAVLRWVESLLDIPLDIYYPVEATEVQPNPPEDNQSDA
jgi:hypothetical protein